MMLAGEEEKTFDEQEWMGVSVVMMQNLPCRCTQEEIEAVVQELGFAHLVSYFHLPQKYSGGRNCGYGFIGFVCPEVAHKFRDAFDGWILKSRTSSKQVRLKPAYHQQNRLHAEALPHKQPASLPYKLQGIAPVHQEPAFFSNHLQAIMPAHLQQTSMPDWLQAEPQKVSIPSRPHANVPAYLQLASPPNRQQAEVWKERQDNLSHATVYSPEQEAALQQKMALTVAALSSEWTKEVCCSLKHALLDFSPPPGLQHDSGLHANVDRASILRLSL